MIEFNFWEYKFLILLSLLVILVLHFLVFKPLLLIRFYLKQGVQDWGYFPLLGRTILQLTQDGKKYNDVMYSQKIVHYKKQGGINAQVTNIFSKVQLTFFDEKLIKELFGDKNKYYIKSKMGQTFSKLLFGEGLFFAEGEKWKKAKKIASKLFTFGEIKNYIPLIEEITNSTLSQIQTGQKINFLELLEQITGTFSLSIFFGRTLEGETIEGKSLVLFIKETQQMVFKLVLNPIFILSGGKIIPSAFRNNSQKIRDKIKKLVKEELMNINEQKKSLVVLYGQEDNFIGGLPRPDLVEDLTNQILVFYVAGTDTSSHLVNMMMYFISQDENLRKKIVEEFGTVDKHLKWEDIKSLTIMESVMNETLRIYGPAIGLMAREATETHKIGNITVLKGTFVQIGMAGNNHHQDRFPDPFKFDYTRWLDKNPTTNQFQFIPFSAGQRNCIGQHLAQIITKVMTVKILNKYKLRVDPDYKLKYILTQSYAPQGPMNFIFENINGQKQP